MSILNYVPEGITLRDSQVAILLEVEASWDRSDVQVIQAPPGSGKSLLAMIIAAWQLILTKKRSAILTHRVTLQEQYQRSFPLIPSLSGVGRYECPTYKMSCGNVKEATEGYCANSCHYLVARTAAESAPVSVFNYHVYAYTKEDRDIMICDEAHGLYDILSEMFTLVLWKHKDKYPDKLRTCGDVALWLEAALIKIRDEIQCLMGSKEVEVVKQIAGLNQTIKRYEKVLSGLQKAPANFFIENTRGTYRGKEQEMLRVRPTTMVGLPPSLWLGKVTQKIILMSGTIGTEDVKKLGFHGRRIKYITGANPIPPENRPVDVSWGVNMSAQFQEMNMPKMCDKIKELADKHSDTKGLVHITYGMVEKLKAHLSGPRYLWHTPDNREAVLEKYLSSKEPVILMACGFSEGLDLAGPEYSFQIIAKLPWPSMSDALIAKYYREDPEWINWLVVRTLEQQVGRICRGPEDYGISYLLDSSFGNPEKKRTGLIDRARHLMSAGFLNSIKWK